jgi:hypothetical protein
MERWISRRFSRQILLNVGTLVAVALMLGAYHTWAAPGPAPQPQAASNASTGLLSYQGYLTDAGGEPLHGEVDVTFRLYSVPTEGTALWTEAHTGENAVPVTDGLFNVMLGSLTPIPDDVWSSGARYLGIQIGDDAEMTPRETIGSVPAALTVPDRVIGNEKLALSYWQANPDSGEIIVQSTDQNSPTEIIRLDVDFAVDGVYLIFAKVISQAEENEQVVAEVWDESGLIPAARAFNTASQTGGDGRETSTIVTIAPFSAGTHTIRLVAYMGAGEEGKIKGYTELNVIPLGQ